LPAGLGEEYSRELFLEDLSSYNLAFMTQGMTIPQIISFVQDMQ